MAKFSSPPAGPLAAGLERDFCRCRLEVLHLFENFTQGSRTTRNRPYPVLKSQVLKLGPLGKEDFGQYS